MLCSHYVLSWGKKLQQCNFWVWQLFCLLHITIQCGFVVFLFKEHGRDPGIKNSGVHIPLQLVSEIEYIQEQMARDNIHFVRFEAADLHGVSRSKSIPSRFFRVCFYVPSCKSSVSQMHRDILLLLHDVRCSSSSQICPLSFIRTV